MMVLVTYDVNTTSSNGARRLRAVAKLCESLGCRVQNSVFELLVDPAQLVRLQASLKEIIDLEHDSVRIYRLGANWHSRVENVGKKQIFEQDGIMML